MNNFQTLGSIINDKKQKKGLAWQVEAAGILDLFKLIIKDKWGEECLAFITPVSIKDKILKVKTSSSQYGTQIQMERQEIINRINERYDREMVKSIRMIID